jgi:hypothetical protein
MYTVWLGKVPVRCDYVDEALALCRRWRMLQNWANDSSLIASMHQPVLSE